MRLRTIALKHKFFSEIIDKVLIPKGFVFTYIDCGQLFFFNPSDSAQGRLLYVSGRYGVGSELLAQKMFAMLIREGDGCFSFRAQ